MSAALRFDAVCKTLAGREVLRGVSFGVGSGEGVGLVGLNGAGKTTLLRALLGLAPPDSGRIAIFDQPSRLPAARESLVYLGENFTPPAFATGDEILRHLLALHGMALDRAAASSEAEQLGLDPRMLERPAREYSKGMAQKLGLIACVLARRPLLVLDEPMSGLDLRARELFTRRLATLKADGVTLFFSTHQLRDVEALCERLVVLHEGTLRFVGTPGKLRGEHGGADLEHSLLACVGVK